jgi:hypothetical protein
MLQTKRLVIGHMTVCSGCCCGAVGRGKPEVPVEWLKREWRSRGLLKNIQLTISCCLGPCDLTNVVKITGPETDVWLGNLHRFDQYASLVDWAGESKAAGALSALPDSFEPHRFNPFGKRADATAEK